MYPRNSASPPVYDIGCLVQTSDGAMQTSGESARVKIGTDLWGAAAGTVACDAASGIYTYTPSQAETNAESFIVAIYKTGCLSISRTIVPTAESTAGRVKVGSIMTDAIDAASVKADAVTKIQTGLATPTNITSASGIQLAANQDVRNVSGTLPAVTLATSQPNYAPAKAGDEMTLTADTLAALFTDTDTTALVNAIIARLESDLDGSDLSVQAIAVAVRNAVLDRVLAGNHETAGSTGKLIQNLNATVSSRATPEQIWTYADRSLTEAVELDSATIDAINAQVVDALSVDTYGELSSPPAATSSLKDKITWMFMMLRNKVTQTSSQRKLHADDNVTVVGTESVTDDGTTYTKGKVSGS
jgi:hypothetical protein